MKFCSKCGQQLPDDAVFCVACGNTVGEEATPDYAAPNYAAPDYAAPDYIIPAVEVHKGPTGLQTAAKIFMILSTILTSIYTFGIGLAWTLPMTISYCKKIKNGQPVSTGFKVCCLIFVSTPAGIFMLCSRD